MTCDVESFCVASPMYAELSSYTEVATLKSYQDGKLNADNAKGREAEFVCDTVELMTELRYEAERNFRDGRTQANNRRGELRLSIEALTDRLTIDTNDEPPQQLVSVIASQHLSLIEVLISSMRKILRRKRDMVSISAVQQVDAHCLRWLARQPGHQAQEKAGSRQKLMAVVREETRNTLENRVLKDFIYRVEILARRYLQQNESRYPASSRVKEVKRLRSCLINALRLPEIQSLPTMKALVQPNYVLLHDARYSKLWELYRLVLAHTRMSEIVWPNRHRLFAEIFLVWVITRLNLEFKSTYDLSYWIKEMPTNGCFFVNPTFTNAFEDSCGGILSCVVTSSWGRLELKGSSFSKRVNLLYIPGNIEPELNFPDNNEIYVICSFSEKDCVRTSHRNNVIWVSSLEQMDSAITELLRRV